MALPIDDHGNSNSAFPDFCLFTAKSAALLISPEVVANVGSIVAGENDQGILDELVARPAGVVGSAECFDEFAKSGRLNNDLAPVEPWPIRSSIGRTPLEPRSNSD